MASEGLASPEDAKLKCCIFQGQRLTLVGRDGPEIIISFHSQPPNGSFRRTEGGGESFEISGQVRPLHESGRQPYSPHVHEKKRLKNEKHTKSKRLHPD